MDRRWVPPKQKEKEQQPSPARRKVGMNKPTIKINEVPKWYTFQYVSELSGLSLSTLYGYNNEGRFENVIQIGKRQLWISREDVIALIKFDPETGKKIEEASDLQSA